METMFETERLTVRKFKDGDAQKLFENHMDDEVQKWFPNECYADLNEAQDAIRFYADCVENGHLPFVLGVELKETNELIGDAGISAVEGKPEETEIGYCIGQKYRGNGYAAELVSAFSGFAVSRFGIKTICGRVVHGNQASANVLEKSGFRFVKEEFGAADDPYGKGMWVYQRTFEKLKDPQSHERRPEHVNLPTQAAQTVRNSLLHFDNHDSRIPYYELMLEQDLAGVTETDLPKGYHYVNYEPGDRAVWIALEKSAREFADDAEGEAAWQRYYAGREKELENRMFFVADESGQKLATATAYYDIRTGDDGQTGWLHWVAVRRDAQGKGLSKPLITHTLQHMQELGYRRAVIPTQTTTWLACKVYLDLGFRPIPRNAERNRRGWEIVKTLTNHPALEKYDGIDMKRILSISYRKLEEKDAEQFIALRISQLREEGAKEELDLVPALRDYYHRHLADGTFVSWLALDQDRIVGTSGMSFVEKPPYYGCPTGRIGLLSSMYTDPEYRRLGIARELLSRVVEEARSFGCGAVQITASDMGVLLYSDFGFRKNGNFMQYSLQRE